MNSALLSFGSLNPRLVTECRLLSLRQFELPVRIGVHAFEQEAAQRMWFDVDLCVRLTNAAAAEDDIGHTLNYDFVRDWIREVVGHKHHQLQETLCDTVLQGLLANPHVQAARVSTRKPDVYPDCASVGTERVAIKPW